MGKYFQADDEMVNRVQRVREQWHEKYHYARIGILMRKEAPVSKGSAVLGKAKVATDEERLLSREDFDFLIWFAADEWEVLTEEQRDALIDHLISACVFANGKAMIRPYDILVGEYSEVIRRHGLWWPGAERTIEAVQSQFGFMGSGRIVAIEPGGYDDDSDDPEMRDVLDEAVAVVEGDEAEVALEDDAA